MKNDLSLRLSYVFRKEQKLLYLKTDVSITTTPQIAYNRTQLSSAGLNSKITYRQIASENSTSKYFFDSALIRLPVRVPAPDVYTKEKLREIIAKYLNNHEVNSQFTVEAEFQELNGSPIVRRVTGISDDADIDIL